MECSSLTVKVVTNSLGFLNQKMCTEESQQWQAVVAWFQTGVQSPLFSGELFRYISQFQPTRILEVTRWHYLCYTFTGDIRTVYGNQVLPAVHLSTLACMQYHFSSYSCQYPVVMDVFFGKLHSGHGWWGTSQHNCSFNGRDVWLKPCRLIMYCKNGPKYSFTGIG